MTESNVSDDLPSYTRLDSRGVKAYSVHPQGHVVYWRDYKALLDHLLPYKEELLKIAADVGEPDDPFAAWEAIALRTPSDCATEGCANAGTERFEAGGVGSNYCPSCAAKVRAIREGDGEASLRKMHPISDEGLKAIAGKKFGINDPGLCAELAAELLTLRAAKEGY